jgi:peptidoglycan-associated lipoprotein
MTKKTFIVLLVMTFVCSSLLLMTSCAKKQVKKEGAAMAAPSEKMPESSMGKEDTEASERAEAERRARMLAMEKEQMLRKKMMEFESENVYFDFDKSELLPQSQQTLRKKARWLQENPDYFVRIEGHCDERGTSEYNLALGERRAQAAKKFLMALGIPEKRLRTISYGEEKPADPRSNETAWAKNRRDEFKLIK